MFRNREHAAQLLIKALEKHRVDHPLILAVPRGAVPMAGIVARSIGADLDVVLVRKIGAPGNPEYAIGSINEFGDIYLTEAAHLYGIPQSYIRRKAEEELRKIQRRRSMYGAVHPPIDPSSRTAIIMDDGIATGSTMVSAIHAVRARSPKRIIVATPVSSHDAMRTLVRAADEVIALSVPDLFFSVGESYDDFSDVSDEEVAHILSAFRTEKPSRAA